MEKLIEKILDEYGHVRFLSQRDIFLYKCKIQTFIR